jgi:hypothetical protein
MEARHVDGAVHPRQRHLPDDDFPSAASQASPLLLLAVLQRLR